MFRKAKEFVSGDNIYLALLFGGLICFTILGFVLPNPEKAQDQKIHQLEKRVHQLELNHRK